MMYERFVLSIAALGMMACSPYHSLLGEQQKTLLQSRDRLLKEHSSEIFDTIEKAKTVGALWYSDELKRYHLIPADSPLEAAFKLVESSASLSHGHSCVYISAPGMPIEPIMYNCLALISEAKHVMSLGKRIEGMTQQMENLTQNVNALITGSEEISKEIYVLNAGLGETRTEMVHIMRDVEARSTGAEEIRKEINLLSAEVGQMRKETEAISTSLLPTIASITRYEKEIDLIKERLQTLHQASSSASTTSRMNYEQIGELGKVITENYEDLNKRLLEIQERLKALK